LALQEMCEVEITMMALIFAALQTLLDRRQSVATAHDRIYRAMDRMR
jgi:hypothetical protein